jgi:hypothetical protein
MKKTTTRLFTSILSLIVSTAVAQSFGLQWAKQIAGPVNDMGTGITIDVSGNIYHCGNFDGTTDFDPSAATYTMTSVTGGGGYITKFDANGNLLWATALPGSAFETAVDAAGNIFVTGSFNGTQDFETGAGTSTLTAATTNHSDMYLCKFNNSGTFLWAGSISGVDAEYPKSITLDGSGNVIIAGIFKNGVDFDPSPTATYTLASGGQDDGFVLKLDNACNFLWAAKFGSSSSYEESTSAKADAAGNIYVTGVAVSTTDFDPGAGYATIPANSSTDIYILKLDAAGNFVWVKGFGSFANDQSNALALDASGNIYITGGFAGTVDFDPSATGTTSLTCVGGNSGFDCFFAKYDGSGNLIFAKNIGSTSYDTGKDIEVSPSGNVYVAGAYSQTMDLDLSAIGTHTMACAGYNDAFLAVFNPTGGYMWSGALNPWQYDVFTGIALNAQEDVYACGSFMFTTDFDPSSGVSNLSSVGFDAFVMKLGSGTAGLKDHSVSTTQVMVYPNPTTSIIIMDVKDITLQNAVVIISDISGREMQQIKGAHQQKITVDLGQYKNGMYFYQLQQDNKIIATGKIIKH